MSKHSPYHPPGVEKRKHAEPSTPGGEEREFKRRKQLETTSTPPISEAHYTSGLNVQASRKRRRPRAKNVVKGMTEGADNGATDRIASAADAEQRDAKKRQKKMAKKAERRERKFQKHLENNPKPSVEAQQQGHMSGPLAARILHQQSRNWSHSPPFAQRFLRRDPIFVRDSDGRDFLIAANPRELQLLSLQDSLLTRTCPAPSAQTVVDFTLDVADGGLVHIAYSAGTISTWRWTTDSETVVALATKSSILAITSGLASGDGTSALCYLARHQQEYRVFHRQHLLYTTTQPLTTIQVLANGSIVCHGPSILIFGMSQEASMTNFTWTEVPLSSISTCLNVQLSLHNNKKKSKSSRFTLGVAVGYASGEIHYYPNASSLLGKTSGWKDLDPPQILHWHREGVSSVKFSADGNYLVSGGDETVLVIWQLETGKKQTLPHLAARIERVVVNPEGNRYAVQLADNSIMVLSTSELKPVATFAGLSTISRLAYTTDASDLPRMSAALNPARPSHLLTSVPASQPRARGDIKSRSFLQTFDLLRSRHLDRQALTRTFVSDNDVPSQNVLMPPDVVHLAISHNGNWLATVDDFIPPSKTISDMGFADSELEEERQRQRQVNLKIWMWDESNGFWALYGLIENPHSRSKADTKGGGKIFDLVSRPKSNSFSTIGEDGHVKTWTVQRHRPSRSAETGIKCASSIELEHGKALSTAKGGSLPTETTSWHLAYSTDGSILAATYCHPLIGHLGPPNRIDFINTSTGTVSGSKCQWANDDIRGIAFLGRYYVVLGMSAVHVWDYPSDKLMYSVNLTENGQRIAMQTRVDLAVNQEDVTFAVVVDDKISVYNPRESKALYEHSFEADKIERALAVNGLPGYTLIFEDVTVRTVSPGNNKTRPRGGHRSFHLREHAIEAANDVASETVDMLANPPMQELSLRRPDDAAVEDDRAVVTAAKLAEICEPNLGGGQASVYDMFWGVMALCARKPSSQPSVVVGTARRP